MKIGLIGINRYAKFLNFACDLHVYAFQRFLAQHGYESTILDYKPAYFNNFNMRNPAEYAEAKYRQAIMRKQSTPAEKELRTAELEKWAELAVDYRSVRVERERRYDKFEAFIAQHLIFTDEVYDSDLLEVEDPGFDAYICVTDVIWQSIPQHGFDRGFLLASKAFEGKPKISYAASRGASPDFTEPRAEQFFGYLRDIDAISVREQDFGEYIQSHSELSVTTVLDPVLLHDRAFWQEITVKPNRDRYVLLYYVMEGAADTIEKAVEYAKLHDLTIVEMSDRPLKYGRVTDPDVKHVSLYDVGMEEWLGYIENAEAVFTNSFHGCCFALLFEKVFFVGSRNGQKVPNFLATFGLTGRRFAATDDVSGFIHEIDYAAVRELLLERRAESATFILDALTRAEGTIAEGARSDVPDYEARRRAIAFPVKFYSRATDLLVSTSSDSDVEIAVEKFTGGGIEYHVPGQRYRNDGSETVGSNRFERPGHDHAGWNVRFRIDNRWFWLLSDGSIATGDKVGRDLEERKAVLQSGDALAHLPVNHVSVVVFVAKWKTRPKAPVRRTMRQRAVGKVKRTLARVLPQSSRSPIA